MSSLSVGNHLGDGIVIIKEPDPAGEKELSELPPNNESHIRWAPCQALLNFVRRFFPSLGAGTHQLQGFCAQEEGGQRQVSLFE